MLLGQYKRVVVGAVSSSSNYISSRSSSGNSNIPDFALCRVASRVKRNK